MDKKSLSERDICTKFITPALRQAGWETRWRRSGREVSFTKGRIIVRGKLVSRGKGKRADYILYYKPQHSHRPDRGQGQHPRHRRRDAAGAGLRRDPEYPLRVFPPTATASSSTTGREQAPSEKRPSVLTPSRRPTTSWARYRAWKGLTPEAESIVLQDYFDDGGEQGPALLPGQRHQRRHRGYRQR